MPIERRVRTGKIVKGSAKRTQKPLRPRSKPVRRPKSAAPAVARRPRRVLPHQEKREARQVMVSFFDLSTVMAKPWADAGYLTYCVDLQHPPGENVDPTNENIIRVGANIDDWLPPVEHEVVFAAFFPPCTDLAVSGARWFRLKGLGKLERAIGLFYKSQQLAELFRCPYLIENPVSTISSYWRPPDYTFHPCEYGNAYLKRTCLWVGGEFVMPPKTPVKPAQGMKLYWLPPSEDRANLRSVTPSGFARAVFKANDPAVKREKKYKRLLAWRQSVGQRWDGRCALTGIRIPNIASAVHVIRDESKPFAGPPSNGIVLSPTVHALFDAGLIAFGDDGSLLYSGRLESTDWSAFSLPAKLRRALTKREKAYLRAHRETVFLGLVS